MSLFLLPKPGTDAQFLVVFNRLAVALREAQDDSGLTQAVYFDALKDVPLAALEAGALALMQESGRKWFPTTAEWRTASERALTGQIQQAVAEAAPAAEVGQISCWECADTGWILDPQTGGARWCPGDGRCAPATCQPKGHTWTRACPCRPTNPRYQHRKHFGAGR